MPAPRDPEEFIALVRKSGVLEEKRLDGYLQKARANMPREVGKLAGMFVRDGLLTNFQGEQFLQGKYKGLDISTYQVLERLGNGVQCSVYLGIDRTGGELVALRVLPAGQANHPGAVARFQRSARAMARFNHPNVVRGREVDQTEHLHLLVMDFVDGSTLKEVVTKRGPLDAARVGNYLGQAAHALFHAYLAAGLIHRDVEPTNVMLDRQGRIKLIDFGLARSFLDEPDPQADAYDATVKVAAEYAAPERSAGPKQVDMRADLFSLGAVGYYLLTGATPARPPRPIREVRADVPPPLAAVIDRLLAPQRDQRYETHVELIEALAPWAGTSLPPPAKDEMPDHCAAVRRRLGR